MKIIVPIKGAVKEGYSISVVSLLDTVTVIGPKEIIGGLRELMTESLDVKNRTSTFKKDLKIINPSPLIRIIKENVSVEIAFETTVEKLFTNIPLKLIYSPNQKVNSEKIALDSLMVKGPKSKMGRLEKKDIEVRIKLTKLPPGDYELAAGLVLPDYIKLVYSKPRKFKVKIY
jgi:YbbR domain-containing protein